MSKTGDYSHITLSQIVSSAKQRLRIESSDEDIFLERYANEGARHFDSLSTFVKRDCEIEIVNGKGRLPNGFYQMLSLTDCSGNGPIYVDMPFLQGCNLPLQNNWIDGVGSYQIQDGWIYFTTSNDYSSNHGVFNPATPPPANATNVANGPVSLTTHMRISFVGLNVDNDGMMVVYSDMERGLVAYCVWMYMLDSPAGKYTAQQIQANEQIWINQKAWYKGIQFQNNFRNTRRSVASIANAWLVQKNWYV